MSVLMHRRHFLQTSAGLGVAAISKTSARGAAPLERVRVGVVGVAGRGAANLGDVARTDLAEIVALCDVDESRATAARQKFPGARFYDDYRRMLEQKDIQAVVLSTPDHHHVFAAMGAMRSGSVSSRRWGPRYMRAEIIVASWRLSRQARSVRCGACTSGARNGLTA
jgi:hypothetical protein